jgi:hypothetical protein
VSDFDYGDLGQIQEKDAAGPNKLLQYGTQLPPTLRLDHLTQYPLEEELLNDILNYFHTQNGNRLKGYKARTGYDPATSPRIPTIRHGAFEFFFNVNQNDLLTDVRHTTTRQNGTLPPFPIHHNETQLKRNELDAEALIKIRGFPDSVKVCTWFETAWGGCGQWPLQQPRFTGESIAFQGVVNQIDQARQARLAANAAGATGRAVAATFQAQDLVKQQVAMARVTLAAKRARTTTNKNALS